MDPQEPQHQDNQSPASGPVPPAPGPQPMSTPGQSGPQPTASQHQPMYSSVQPGYGHHGQHRPHQSQHTDTLGIVSLVLAGMTLFMGITALPGLIVGIIGMRKAAREGYSKTLSLIGTVLNGVFVVPGVLSILLFVVFVLTSFDGA